MAVDNIVLQPAETDAEIGACWPLMQSLRPHLGSVELFVRQVARQREKGYRLLMAWEADQPAALAGWRVQENFVHGTFLYVDDLVTWPGHRGKGLGARLLGRLADEGRRLGCAKLVLDTAVTNIAAQRFYAREGLCNRALGFSTPL